MCCDKITNIRNKLDKNTRPPCIENKLFSGTKLSDFVPLSQDEVRILIKKSKTNHNMMVDPIPTFLVKDCIDELLPLITEIINTSLELGDMPDILKHAKIKPLLKKLGLALEEKN